MRVTGLAPLLFPCIAACAATPTPADTGPTAREPECEWVKRAGSAPLATPLAPAAASPPDASAPETSAQIEPAQVGAAAHRLVPN